MEPTVETSQMSVESLSTVRWYRSLRFRLFLFLVIALFASVSAISVQNSRMFREMLEQQLQQETTDTVRRSANSAESIIEVWRSLLTVFMHGVKNMDLVVLDAQLRAILDANREIVAVHVIKLHVSAPSESIVFGLTPYVDAPQFGVVKAQTVLEKLKELSLTGAGSSLVVDEKSLIFENLSRQTGVDLLLFGLPFVSLDKSERYLALFVVWSDRLKAALHVDDRTIGFLAKGDGQVILDSSGVEKELGLLGQRAYLPVILNSQVSFGFQVLSDLHQTKTMVAFSKVADTKMAIVLEREAGSIFAQLEARIRRIALFAWILVLMAMLLVYWGAGRVTRHILDTVKTTFDIASGNLQARVKVGSNDEIGILSRAVNHMVDELEKLINYREIAARQEHELKTAQAIQRTLLPRRLPRDTRLDIRGYYRSASECGGDWWDFFAVSETKTLVVIADATGHGAHAAILVAIAFGFFEHYSLKVRENSALEEPLIDILKRLNQVLWASGDGNNTMTMVVAQIDTSSKKLVVASAGHVPSYLFSVPSAGEHLVKSQSIMLGSSIIGMRENPRFDSKEFEFVDDMRLVIYTDGLIECENVQGKALGRRLRSNLDKMVEGLNGSALFDTLSPFIEDYFKEAELTDDITCVVLEYRRNSDKERVAC